MPPLISNPTDPVPAMFKLLPKLNVPPTPLIIILGIDLPLEVIVLVPLVAANVNTLVPDAVTVIPLDKV